MSLWRRCSNERVPLTDTWVPKRLGKDKQTSLALSRNESGMAWIRLVQAKLAQPAEADPLAAERVAIHYFDLDHGRDALAVPPQRLPPLADEIGSGGSRAVGVNPGKDDALLARIVVPWIGHPQDQRVIDPDLPVATVGRSWRAADALPGVVVVTPQDAVAVEIGVSVPLPHSDLLAASLQELLGDLVATDPSEQDQVASQIGGGPCGTRSDREGLFPTLSVGAHQRRSHRRHGEQLPYARHRERICAGLLRLTVRDEDLQRTRMPRAPQPPELSREDQDRQQPNGRDHGIDSHHDFDNGT